ncbi:ribonuclease HIII [Thermocrinis minervae]|uniref:Ribonuclease n=1 Tax=Thermocrinis minervae TaxID=381751 RepID=A0A1M6R3Z2_9AQUI|nr:ribonuclease HIII [Thermocrinis minervae]SHK27189.1 ribonuclease HIII [Thermocrinis minervae]
MNITLKLPVHYWETVKDLLISHGFTPIRKDYTLWALEKKGQYVHLYPSGILLIQGKDPQGLKEFILGSLPEEKVYRVGCDESGKGDFFGPIVFSCVLVKPENYKRLWELSPKDSKDIKEEEVFRKAELLRPVVDVFTEVLEPKEFNRLYREHRNLNTLMTITYRKLISSIKELLKDKEHTIVIDGYRLRSPFDGGVIFEPDAERHYPEVASASIFARESLLRWLKERNLPKGSSSQAKIKALEIYHKDRRLAEELLKISFLESK